MSHEVARDGPLREPQIVLREEVDDELLERFFSLSDADREEILRCRGDDNRLGFALALCFYRMTGRFPTSYEVIPLRAVNEVGAQLGIGPVRALAYPASDDTRWEHERRVRDYLHVRPFDDKAREGLSAWIMDIALDGELPENLRERAEAHLRKQNVFLPGSTVLDRVVQHALAEADEVCIRKVLERVDKARHDDLLGLIRERRGRGRPLLTRLKKLTARASPAAVKELSGHIESLRRLGGGAIDLSGIPPALVGRLARVVDECTPSVFRQMRRDRALAFLACFVAETLPRTIDTLLYADHRMVTAIWGDARDDYGEWLQERAQATDEEGRLLAEIVAELREASHPVDRLWARLLRKHTPGRIDRALAVWADRVENKRSVLDEVIRRYPYLRKFTPRILDAVEFDATAEGQAVLEGLEALKGMNAARRKQLPEELPLRWATPTWRRKVQEAQEEGSAARARRTWETGLWLAAHEALQAGTLCVRGSRRYRPLKELVHGEFAWNEGRVEAYAKLGLPQDPREFVAHLRSRYLEIVHETDSGLPSNPHARIVDGRLRLSRDPAEVSVKDLVFYRNLIQDHFPLVDLDQLLIQVSRRVGYLRHFRTVSSFASRVADLDRRLLVCIFGLGCNLDLSRLARSTGVKRDVIADTIRRYCHLEHLVDANAALVNYHHGLPLSGLWGSGEHSGSDGQRHRVHGHSLLAGFLPWVFGHHGQGFTIYRHTSDQHNVFSTLAVSTLDRESQYALDGLVDNRTVLRPVRHSTDTHGASDIVFGLMTLLGYDFCPRIARLHRQRLFRIPGMPIQQHLEPLFDAEPVPLDLIIEEWDNLVRLAASIKDRLVAPSVLIRQLESAPAASRTAVALRALGRIAKTLFLLRYIQHPELRRHIRRQLNRCEAENDLGHFVVFGERGVYRAADLDFLVDRSQCTTIVMNNIVVWNTEVLASEVLPALKERGIEVPQDVLAHLSPLMRRHINPYGEYRFDLSPERH